MPRRGLRDRLLPWSGSPDEPVPGPPSPRWPSDGPSDEWRWVDQALGVPRATVHGAPGRRRLAVVALVTAIAIVAGALAVLGTRPGARKNAAPPAGTGASASGAPTFA